MTRLESIYRDVVHEFPESRIPDTELGKQIDEAVRRMDCQEEEKSKIREVMFTGSSYGQSAGFKQGFRFAVALLAEIIV